MGIRRGLALLMLLVAVAALYWQASYKRAAAKWLLAHNLPTDHPVHLGILRFADEVKTRTGGSIEILIYPNGQIGAEKEVLELVQLGAVGLTKVSSLSLEAFTPVFGVINTPFIFRDKNHLFSFQDGVAGEEFLNTTRQQKFQGLAYFDSGERSFYATKPIRVPDDLKGLKIRVMGSPTAIRMMELLGGHAAPMPFGEVYTALQQGLVDGAENNVTALTIMRHGEVAKYYSEDEHIMAPDVLLVSQVIWDALSPELQSHVKAAAKSAQEYQREVWREQTAVYMKEAQEKLKVQVIRPEKSLFREKTAPLIREMAERSPAHREWVEKIQSL